MITDVNILSDRLEKWVKAASTKYASEQEYLKKLELLGISNYQEIVQKILTEYAEKIVAEMLFDKDWAFEKQGPKRVDVGIFEPTPSKTIEFRISVPEWVLVSSTTEISLKDAFSDFKKFRALVEDVKVQGYLIQTLREKVQGILRHKYFPDKELENLSEIVESELVEIDRLNTDVSKSWAIVLKPLNDFFVYSTNNGGKTYLNVQCTIQIDLSVVYR